MQVDNPVSLLNQDTSRHFLQKSKPGEKYKLFMKATHLEQIATDYEQAELDQRIMREGIKRQEKVRREKKGWETGSAGGPEEGKHTGSVCVGGGGGGGGVKLRGKGGAKLRWRDILKQDP